MLSNRQENVLRAIHARAYTKQVEIVNIENTIEIGGKSNVLLNFTDDRELMLHRSSAKNSRLNDTGVMWTGIIEEDPAATVKLSVWGDDVLGQFRTRDINFLLEPLGGGLHALIEIDPSKFERESHSILAGDHNETETNKKGGSSAHSTQSDPEIKVLVAYTTNAKNNFGGNMNQLIELAADYTNDSFTLSNVSASIDIVHTVEVAYSESSNDILNLCRLTTSLAFTPPVTDCTGIGTLSGYMENVHYLRYDYGANLVVLITGSQGAGIGWMHASIPATYAFSIARYDYAAANYTFAHEIGHNIGANHDLANASNSPFDYGHGYRYEPMDWHTIMSYGPSGDRINYWSNPDKTLGGVPMGSEEDEDNARVWNERASAVSNLNAPTQPPHAPTNFEITNSGWGMPELAWTASTSPNIAHYQIWRQERRNSDGYLHTPVQLGTTSSTTYTDWDISMDSPTASDWRWYAKAVNTSSQVSGNSNSTDWISGFSILKEKAEQLTPEIFALHPAWPNPFNPSTAIRYDLPLDTRVRISVVDMLGREVAVLVNEPKPAGTHTLDFNASTMVSGVYLVRMQAGDFIHTRKIMLLK